MNDKTSHPLAVRTPLSKLYLALFSAPLLMLAPADLARADDAIFDGDSKITESLAYTGDVYVGRNQSGNLLIENGKISAYNINIGRMFNGQIHDSVVTVRGPNAELNAVNDQFVLRGGLNLGRGTLRVEDGALASAKEIVVGTTRGYDSHLIATGAGSRVTSNFLSVGTDLGARSTLAIEDGAVLSTAFDARIGNGSGPGESDTLSPKATVTGANSQWNVGRALTLYGDLDVLNGAAVNVGNIQVAGVSGARKTAELVVAGNGSRFTSGSSVNVGDYGNGVLAVMDGGTFSAGGNEVVLGKTGSGSNRGALIIGSRGNMDTGTGLTEPTLGAAGAAGTIDAQTAIALRGGLFRSYVYFNHTDGNYVFSNKMSGEGEVINTAGHTTLNGDLTGLQANVTARGGKLIIASDINTQKEDDIFEIQTLGAENGGTLILNATAGTDVNNGLGYSSAASIKAGGTLGGNGTLGQTEIQSGGHISPGDGNIGTLTLKRYLNFIGESFYDVDIAGDGRSDQLLVAGKTTISDQAKVQVTALDPQTSYKTGQSYRILTSDGGIDGQFAAAVSKSAFLDVALNHSANAVDLTIAQKDTGGENPGGENPGGENPGGENPGGENPGGENPGGENPGGENPGGENPGGENPGSGKPGIFQTVAESGNQWNTAGALSTLTQSGPSLALYNSLLLLSAPEAREAFNQLSGEVYPSMQSNLIAGSTQLFNVLNQRMLRLFDNDSLPVPPLAMSLVQPAPAQNSGVWGQTFSSWGRNSGNGNVGKLDGNTTGFLLGAERKLADHNVRIGGYFGYSRGDYDVDSRRSKADTDNYHLGLYAAGQQDAFSLRGALGYTWHKIEGKRNVDFSGFSDRLKSDYDANSLLAFTEAGYRFGQPEMNVEPFINLSYIRLHTDSFQESGGAAALSVRNETMNTFYSTLGVRGVTELPKNVSLYGSLGWQHAYGDKNTSSRMAFAGSDAFVTQGQAVDDNVMVGDIGVSVKLSRAATLDVGYQGQFGADTRVNSVNANLRWSF
ncbi:autotransporter outer membrane beta-barrel domain-containing protein [Serratia marcescens]|uniref:autotransporter outer membrane beta-barrel domain-containing protein n=1 Tax=Serratia marcescens TaxID=615 RepID=UPI000E583BD4|nr:autotransporter outer membrane beta-barrel domain-containing protein [Serratia marcescens]AXX19327.1 autotransporter outer membrane beta-barrel domain-containing protein [Serratia marcescens]AXX23253.1 autotransporter outer membrane beta-barrel domain-containing protein [Serratia marcescens]MBH2603829.1 autotransporter domain-containing protein [Serratia marcescens]MBH2891939.1 autotransporter domain-containing protein [Serratia marcescens]MBN5392993.1 autotransporter domain-containing prot